MENLKKLRKSKGLTCEELGNLVGLHKTAISKYELGRIQPSKDILFKLSEIFDCSIDYLLDKTDNPLSADQKQSPLPELGTIEWFRQGLIKYGIVKNGEDLTDSQFQFLLDNVGHIAEQLKNKQINNNH